MNDARGARLPVWAKQEIERLENAVSYWKAKANVPKRKDKYGRAWQLPPNELCSTCGQPDSCGDCNHKKLRKSDVLYMSGTLAKGEE